MPTDDEGEEGAAEFALRGDGAAAIASHDGGAAASAATSRGPRGPGERGAGKVRWGVLRVPRLS